MLVLIIDILVIVGLFFSSLFSNTKIEILQFTPEIESLHGFLVPLGCFPVLTHHYKLLFVPKAHTTFTVAQTKSRCHPIRAKYNYSCHIFIVKTFRVKNKYIQILTFICFWFLFFFFAASLWSRTHAWNVSAIFISYFHVYLQSQTTS